MTNIRLSLALAVSEQPGNLTRLVLDGSVRADGIDLIPSDVYSGELIWRQLRFAEFDVAQMSVTALLMLAERGSLPLGGHPSLPLPLFPSHPLPGEGRLGNRVGGRPSGQAHRGRGVHDDRGRLVPGRPPRRVQRRHGQLHLVPGATGQHRGRVRIRTPGDVVINQIPAGRSIASLLSAGELDGVCIHIAGHTLLDRTGTSVDAMPTMRPLFPDPAAESARYYQKTGVLPINHCIAIRRSVLEDHPWVALNLYKAFMEAKEQLLAPSRRFIDTYFQLGHLPIAAQRSLPSDPMPYGIAANRNTLETIARYAEEQGLTKRRVGLEEIFSPNTMDT